MARNIQPKKGERGTSILEFGLVAIPTVFLMLGVVVFGINIGRSVEVAQVCRDTGSMFVRGVDFNSTGSRSIVVRLARNLNLQLPDASGNAQGYGLITLSKVTFIPDSSCGAVGSAGWTNCTVGRHVLMQRVKFGNTSDSSIAGTRFTTQGSVTFDSEGNVANYSTDQNATIPNFSSTLQLKTNEVSFISEAYFKTPDLIMSGFANNPGVYAVSFF